VWNGHVMKHETSQLVREAQPSLQVRGTEPCSLPSFRGILAFKACQVSSEGDEKRRYTGMHAPTFLILQRNVFGRRAREQIEKKTSVPSEEGEG
jgi:hypothetical protein